jgi:sulfoquinovosyltransferase
MKTLVPFLLSFLLVVQCYQHCAVHEAIWNQKIQMMERKDVLPPELCYNPPMKILLIVEPSPFTYISGYKNRFQEMLKYLKSTGDEVQILTPEKGPSTQDFLGFPIHSLRSFPLPMYPDVRLTDISDGTIGNVIRRFQPDVVHVSTPSLCVFPAIYHTWKENIPLVMSYHTNIIEYTRSYLPYLGLHHFMRFLLKKTLSFADLVLTTSPQLQTEIQNLGVVNVDVWLKGINLEVV